MNVRKLSADPISIILGIICIVTLFLGCCCGLLIIPALVMAIVGLVMANQSLNDYFRNPDEFNPKSRRNVATGKTLCIIGIGLSTVYLIIVAVYFIVYGALISDRFTEKFKELKNIKREIQYETAKDSIEDERYQSDTIFSDTTIIIEKTIK